MSCVVPLFATSKAFESNEDGCGISAEEGGIDAIGANVFTCQFLHYPMKLRIKSLWNQCTAVPGAVSNGSQSDGFGSDPKMTKALDGFSILWAGAESEAFAASATPGS